jgi:hypothetical protein
VPRRGRWFVAVAGGLGVLAAQVAYAPIVGATVSPTSTGVEVAAPYGAATNPSATGLSVSCSAPGTCFEVGDYLDSSGYQWPALGDIADGNAEQYFTFESFLPANALSTPSDDRLGAISCPNVGQCEAVGTYDLTAGGEGGYALTWDNLGFDDVQNGSVLQVQPPATTTSPQVTVLDGISCVTINNCVAVGAFSETGLGVEPMIAQETNGVWATGITPTNEPAGEEEAALLSDSCTSAGNCVATGVALFPSGEKPIIEQETNGVWASAPTVAQLPNDVSVANPNAGLLSVSCLPSGTCEAVGEYENTTGNTVPLTYQRVGGTWQSPGTVSLPGDAATPNDAVFGGVSCIVANDLCEAVGTYTLASGGGQSMSALSRGGTWHGAQSVPSPAQLSDSTPSSDLTGIYCQQSGACTAVGRFEDFASDTQFMWAPVNTPPSPVLSISVAPSTTTSARVSWVPSVVTGAGTDHYEVYVSSDGGVSFSDRGSSGTATSMVVTGLALGHTYHFEVVAVDVALVNSGPTFTGYVQYTTPTAPRSPHATPTPLGATLSWLAPSSTGFSAITSYKVTITGGGATKTLTTTTTHLVVSGLSKTVTYSFHVQAVNKAGPGMQSPVVHFKPAA